MDRLVVALQRVRDVAQVVNSLNPFLKTSK